MAWDSVILKGLDILVEHPEKVGGSGVISLAAVVYGARKYLQAELKKVYLKIREEQEADAEEFEKHRGAFKKLKTMVDSHTEAFRIIERRLNVKKDKIAEQQEELARMIAELQKQEEHFIAHAHKLDLNERDLRLMQGLFADCIADVKDIATRSTNLEVSFAKVLGALSGKID